MNPYVFMTDSDSDLPFRYVDELDMTMVYMPYILDGKEYFDDLGRSGRGHRALGGQHPHRSTERARQLRQGSEGW